MRLSNRNKAPFYHFTVSVLTMLLVFGAAGFFLDEYRVHILKGYSYFLLLIPVLLWAVFIIRGRQIFEYDSDGEALNFKNRNILKFLGKDVSDEFPKYKLMHYDVVGIVLFRRLYITIASKKSSSIILKYDISYLSGKENRDLEISLNKVVKENNENRKANT